MASAPPSHVLSAFRCYGQPIALPGGEGLTWRCGDTVLKPCGDPSQAAWIADVFLGIDQEGFRVPEPVRASDGAWVVGGWQAWTYVPGFHARDRWDEVLRTCRAFHVALRGVSKPPFLAQRDDPFARADRIAWGEEVADCHPRIMPVMRRLQALRQPVRLPSQVIHGDVTENVLFDPPNDPAVIDFSPYWRPADYAQAIVVIDALDWGGADPSILRLVEDVPDIDQLLVRAELFRIAIYDGFARIGIDNLAAVERHLPTVALLERRLSASGPTP